MQSACYNELAITLCTPATRQQSRKEHHVRAVFTRDVLRWLPIRSFVFLSQPATCIAWGLSRCVIFACCHTQHAAAAAAVEVRDFRELPSVVESCTPFFGSSFSVVIFFIPVHYTTIFRVPRVCVRCVSCATSKVFANFFFLSVVLGSVRDMPFSPWAPQQRNALIMYRQIWYNVWRNHKEHLLKRFSHINRSRLFPIHVVSLRMQVDVVLKEESSDEHFCMHIIKKQIIIAS